MPTKEELTASIKAVGDSIRELKASKAAGDAIAPKVAELKTLKDEYQKVTGEPFDPPSAGKKDKKKEKKEAPPKANASEGPSKNELKKLAKAAKKDEKRAAHKTGASIEAEPSAAVKEPPKNSPAAAAPAAALETPAWPSEPKSSFGPWLVDLACAIAGIKSAALPAGLTEANAAARFMVEGSKCSGVSELIGSGPLAKAEVSAWMSLAAKSVAVGGPAEGLDQRSLAEALARRSFLVGDRLSLADLALALALACSDAPADPQQTGAFVARWAATVAAWTDQCARGAPAAKAAKALNSLAAALAACAASAAPASEEEVGSVSLPKKRLARLVQDGASAGEAKKPAKCPAKGAAKEGEEKPEAGAPKKTKKKEKKEAKAPAVAAAAVAGDLANKKGGDEGSDFVGKLDIRVGKIVKAWEHPESDKLWCEEIDLGESSGPRTICSGLRAFYATADEVASGRLVLVVANLKPRKMAGVSSEGMVLCASSPAHDVVKFVEVPPGSAPGDRVSFEGRPEEPAASPAQVTKKKMAETVIFGGQLVTVKNDDKSAVCTFKGESAMVITGKGKCTAPVPAGYTVA